MSHFSFLFRKIPVFFFVCSFLGSWASAVVKRRPSKGHSFWILKKSLVCRNDQAGLWLREDGMKYPWSSTASLFNPALAMVYSMAGFMWSVMGMEEKSWLQSQSAGKPICVLQCFPQCLLGSYGDW